MTGPEMMLVNMLKMMGINGEELQKNINAFGQFVTSTQVQLNRIEAQQTEILNLLRGNAPIDIATLQIGKDTVNGAQTETQD